MNYAYCMCVLIYTQWTYIYYVNTLLSWMWLIVWRHYFLFISSCSGISWVLWFNDCTLSLADLCNVIMLSTVNAWFSAGVCCQVVTVSYLRLSTSPVVYTSNRETVSAIPLGAVLTFTVHFHDSTGETLHSHNSVLSFSTNRWPNQSHLHDSWSFECNTYIVHALQTKTTPQNLDTYYAKSNFTWCLDINVWTHPPYNDTIPPPLNQVSLTRPAVLILTAVWCHIAEGGATGVDWQPCIAIVSVLSGYAVLRFLRSCNVNNVSVFGCTTEHKSLHFLPSSELLRTLWAPHLWD